jgi:[phosphatase 2A protein]-leucine-carboxy methyltransferase
LKEIRKSYITSEELERYHGNAFLGTFSLTPILRISRLEFLDETEELDLVLAHYAISWGLFLGNSDMCENWGQWGLKQPE